MRIALDGDDEVVLLARADDVRDSLADPVDLLATFGDLLDPASRPHRWVVSEAHVGRATLAPAIDVAVETENDGTVRVRGTPVDGYTPTTLHIELLPTADDGRTRLASRWRFSIEVPGPQLLAGTLRPVLSRSSRRTTREIRARLHDRFGGPEG